MGSSLLLELPSFFVTFHCWHSPPSAALQISPPFGFVIICLFSSSEITAEWRHWAKWPAHWLEAASSLGRWRRRRLHTPVGTRQKQVLEESPTQLNRGNICIYIYINIFSPPILPREGFWSYRNVSSLERVVGLCGTLVYGSVSHEEQPSIQRFYLSSGTSSSTFVWKHVGRSKASGYLPLNPFSWDPKVLRRIWEPMTALNLVVSSQKLSQLFWRGIVREQEVEQFGTGVSWESRGVDMTAWKGVAFPQKLMALHNQVNGWSRD